MGRPGRHARPAPRRVGTARARPVPHSWAGRAHSNRQEPRRPEDLQRAFTLRPPGTARLGPTRRALGFLLFAVREIEPRAKTPGQLQGVVVCPEMHVEEARLVAERMVMERRHLDAV